MTVDVPTKVIPLWFIEKWTKENCEPESPLDAWIKEMINDWQSEETRLT